MMHDARRSADGLTIFADAPTTSASGNSASKWQQFVEGGTQGILSDDVCSPEYKPMKMCVSTSVRIRDQAARTANNIMVENK